MGGLATWAKTALAKGGKLPMGAACAGAAWGKLRLAQAPSGEWQMPQAEQCACWLLSQSLVPCWASADAQCAMLSASGGTLGA